MRLRRSLLVIAAGLSASLPAANIVVDDANPLTISSLTSSGATIGLTGNTFTVGNDGVLTLDLRNALNAPIDVTYNGSFLGNGFIDVDGATVLDTTGFIVKTGGGTFQYNGFGTGSITPLNYLGNATFDTQLLTPIPSDLRPRIPNPAPGNPLIEQVNAGANQAFSGIILVQQGQLQVSGHINQWGSYGPYAAVFGEPTMHGARATVVENGAKLSFRNTTRNIVGAGVTLDNPDNTPKSPLIGRLNYVQNLLATTASRVETGPDDDYILIIHSDIAGAGLNPDGIPETTLGILEGRGRVFKTGASDLRITNASSFTGEFVANGGRVILAAGSGDTLWSARSVNLASGGNGSNVASPPVDVDWKPGYAPGNAGATTLVVQGSQRIRNFQSLYRDAGFNAMLATGTGDGNFIELVAATDILTIDQEAGFDGYFKGSIVGADDPDTGQPGVALGTFRKTGLGALALFSEGNNMSKLEILGGRLIASVESLGQGEVFIDDDAQLSIVQNRAGALRALIRTESTDMNAELRFRSRDNIQYRGAEGASLGNDDEGVADIVRAQELFFGKVIVEDGNDIVFSAGINDAFRNASAIILEAGPSGRETSIRFNDTNQIVRNLQGDSTTRIFLGRGDITLVNTEASNYAGTISGVGNLIKSGPNAFTLAGANNYFGATVVQGGSLAATSASGIGNTSGLIVASGATFTATSAQAIGSLFGQAGSTATFGGALVVGVSSDLRTRLVTELASLPGDVPATSAAYFLATENAGPLPGFDFSPDTTVGYVALQYGLIPDTNGTAGIQSDEVDAFVAAATPETKRTLLAFSGALTIGGSLTKVGTERLTLLGSVTFSGADKRVLVEDGTLEVALATLSGASGVTLGSTGVIELAVTGAPTLPFSLDGSGTFRKTGAGDLRIDRGSATAFDGTYDLVEGDLTVVFNGFGSSGVAREGKVATAAGTTFTAEVANNLSWGGEVYGDGNFTKTGAGILTMDATTATGPIFTTGKVSVLGGGLVAGAVPRGDLEIASGATFTAELTQDDFFEGVLSGGGAFIKKDRTGPFDLRLETTATLTGSVQVLSGSLSLGAEQALRSASSVNLAAGTRLNLLDGFAQTLTNVTAADDVVVDVELPATELTLDVATGQDVTFNARITGSPEITKTGAGTLRFLRLPPLLDNAIASIDIQAGVLVASRSGLGGADINVAEGGTLSFFAPEGADDDYAGLVITGTGSIAKSGAGIVDLSGSDLTTVSTTFAIADGTLVVSRDALGNTDARPPEATLATATSTLEFITNADVTFNASLVTGLGNLTLGGAGQDITLNLGSTGAPGYEGTTTLRSGVTVTVAADTGAASLGGLASEAGSTLSSAGLTSLTFELAGETDFLGEIIGGADLVLSGTGTLDLTGGDTLGDLDGYAGTVTVSGSNLVLASDNDKALVLESQGRLVLLGDESDSYVAGLTGDGTGIVALGADVTLDLVANPGTSLDDGFVDRLQLLTGSRVVMNLSGSSLDKAANFVFLGGSLDLRLTEATGTLTLEELPAAPVGSGGIIISSPVARSLEITGDVSGDLLVGDNVSAILRGDLGGDLAVDAGGSLQLGVSGSPVAIGGAITVDGLLTGSAVAQGVLAVAEGAVVRPGFSPGTITVGSLVNSGLLDMELGAAAYDQILFNNTAELNNGGTGTLRLAKHGAGSLIAKRFSLISYDALPTPPPGAGAFVGSGAAGRFASVTSTGPDAPRVILFYPTALASDARLAIPGLAKDGEVAAYVVRDTAAYDTLLAGNAYLSNVKAATKVDLNAAGPDFTSDLAPTFTSFGARLAILDDAALLKAVDNLRPRGHAAALSGAVAGFRTHADTLQRRLEQRRFDGADMSVKTDDWFVDATQAQLDLDNGHEARNTGATAGLIRPMGVDGYWAVSLGVENLKADGGATSYKGNGFRIGGALGVMNVARTLSLDAGLSMGQLGGDLSRPSLGGGSNVTDPKATTLGLWVRASAATTLGGLALTPFVSLEHSQTSMDKTAETGSGDPLGDSLTVRDVDHTQTAARAGFGLHHSWVSQGGDWRYRLGLDVAYAMQVDGEDATLSANHAQLGGSDVSSTLGILPGDGFSVAPTFTFGPSPDSTFTVGLRLEQGSEGEATSLQLGYRRKF